MEITMMIGDVLVREGDFDLAVKFYNASINIADSLGYEYFICQITIRKSLAYYLQKEYDVALEILEDAEETAKNCRDVVLNAHIAVARYKIYTDSGDFGKAHEVMADIFRNMYPYLTVE